MNGPTDGKLVPMDQIFPTALTDVDPSESLTRSMMARREIERDRPWVFANMIMSADGAFARDGRSGGLGGSADKAMFHLLRGVADAILVGAGTARAERYRRPSSDESTAVQRKSRSQTRAPSLAVISSSGKFPDDQPFLTGDGPDPLVFLPGSNLARINTDRTNVPIGLDYRSAGVDFVDLTEVLTQLASVGARLVLCEGGPQLLGDLVAAGLLDQIFITVAPQLVAGTHTGLLGSHPELSAGLDLQRVITHDGFLLLNYTVHY